MNNESPLLAQRKLARREELVAGYLDGVTQRLFNWMISYPGCIHFLVDGMGASGKGTLGADLSQAYKTYLADSGADQREVKQLVNLSSGIFYRAITLWAIVLGLATEGAAQRQSLHNRFSKVALNFRQEGDISFIEIVDQRHTYTFTMGQLFTDKRIGKHISYIGGLDFIAERMDQLLVELTCKHPLVFLDSRDNYNRKIGMEKKIISEERQAFLYFLYMWAQEATIQERAVERMSQKLGRTLTPEERAAEHQTVSKRNEGDFTRPTGRLLRPGEAEASAHYHQIIETSTLIPSEVLLLFTINVSLRVFDDQASLILLDQVLTYFQQREEWIQEMVTPGPAYSIPQAQRVAHPA